MAAGGLGVFDEFMEVGGVNTAIQQLLGLNLQKHLLWLLQLLGLLCK
jgi:hypothetical protein